MHKTRNADANPHLNVLRDFLKLFFFITPLYPEFQYLQTKLTSYNLQLVEHPNVTILKK